MQKFIITEKFFHIFPDAEIGVILATNLDKSSVEAEDVKLEIEADLKESNKNALKYIPSEPLSENKVIAVWREAFQKFKTKKGARCSIEALLRRVSKGNEIGSIIPLVDIYNTVSLNYAIPCGGEDIDSIKGDMLLTIADGGEAFKPLGSENDEPALTGEVIYKDDEGAVCRCWNWREGERTMLTENTKNAFLIIESVDPERHCEFLEAVDALEASISIYCGCKTEKFLVNKDNREVVIS